jgi:hypothetical protein
MDSASCIEHGPIGAAIVVRRGRVLLIRRRQLGRSVS